MQGDDEMGLSKGEKIRMAEMNAIDDKDINFDDIPRLTEEQLNNLKPSESVMISIRMDRDVLDYYKSQEKGLIMEILREHMNNDKIGDSNV